MNRYLPNGKLNPDMPDQTLRLIMGELTAQEMRTARAAIRICNAHSVKCDCALSQRLQGDGCRYCNPQECIDALAEENDEMRKELMG